MIKRCIIFIAFVGLLFIVPGCGGGDDIEGAPADATITINPSEISVSDASALATPHSEYFHIVVEDAAGFPLRNIRLTIRFWLAVPDIYGVVLFYHGGSPVDSPFNALTDDNGAYILRMDFYSGGGLEYNGTLQVTSGSA
ncbi:MAG: hypothetical protein V3R28_04120, partial [Desulfatiglandales bacterium]